MKRLVVVAAIVSAFGASAEPVPQNLGIFKIGMTKMDLVDVRPAMPCHSLANDFTCSTNTTNKWVYIQRQAGQVTAVARPGTEGVEVWSLGPASACADLVNVGGNCVLRFKDAKLVNVVLISPKEKMETLVSAHGKPEIFDNSKEQTCDGKVNKIGYVNHAWGTKEEIRVNFGTLFTQGKTCDVVNAMNFHSVFNFEKNSEVTAALWAAKSGTIAKPTAK